MVSNTVGDFENQFNFSKTNDSSPDQSIEGHAVIFGPPLNDCYIITEKIFFISKALSMLY